MSDRLYNRICGPTKWYDVYVTYVINNLFQAIQFQLKWKWLNAACDSVFLDDDVLSCGQSVESVGVCVCVCVWEIMCACICTCEHLVTKEL
jgi:hypothetical protein